MNHSKNCTTDPTVLAKATVFSDISTHLGDVCKQVENHTAAAVKCRHPADFFDKTGFSFLYSAKYAANNTTITFECLKNFVAVSGDLEVHCKNGKWVGTEPHCVQDGIIGKNELMALIIFHILFVAMLVFVGDFACWKIRKHRFRNENKQIASEVRYYKDLNYGRKNKKYKRTRPVSSYHIGGIITHLASPEKTGSGTVTLQLPEMTSRSSKRSNSDGSNKYTRINPPSAGSVISSIRSSDGYSD